MVKDGKRYVDTTFNPFVVGSTPARPTSIWFRIKHPSLKAVGAFFFVAWQVAS